MEDCFRNDIDLYVFRAVSLYWRLYNLKELSNKDSR
jgi:hypothetical protein